MYDANIFHDNIKRILEDNNLTQTQLGDILKAKQSRISSVLSGKNEFTLEQAFTIAEHFNISLDKMIGLHSKAEVQTLETLSDIENIIFSLFETGLFEIRRCDIPEKDTTQWAFTSDNEHIEKFFDIFNDCINLCEKSSNGKAILSAWKEKELQDSKNRIISLELKTYWESYYILKERFLERFYFYDDDSEYRMSYDGVVENLCREFSKDDISLMKKFSFVNDDNINKLLDDIQEYYNELKNLPFD